MGDSVEKFAKAKVNYTHCYLLLTDPVILSGEAIRLNRHALPLVNPCSLFPITFFSFTCPEMCFKNLLHNFPRDQNEADWLQFPGLFFWPFLVIGNLPQLPQHFKGDRECPCKHIGQFPQHPQMQPVGYHRVLQVEFSQVIPGSMPVQCWLFLLNVFTRYGRHR